MLARALKYLLISIAAAFFAVTQTLAADSSWQNQQNQANQAAVNSTSNASVPQGDISPAQSGPGAVGLFTPSSPGNAAAYNAQLHGGLEGAPIVDGTGSNMVVKVPYATSSGEAAYKQITTGDNAAAVSGSSASIDSSAGAFSASRFFNTPASASLGSAPEFAGSAERPPAPNGGRAFSKRAPVGVAQKQLPAPPRLPVGANYRATQHRSYAPAPAAHRHIPQPLKSSGFIQYADGQTVRFGVGDSGHP